MREHRLHPRKPTDLAARVGAPGQTPVPAHCDNLSVGGVFLSTTATIPFGTVVMVGLTGDGTTWLEVEGTVRWARAGEQPGLGVQFAPMGVRETRALLALLA